MKSSALHCTVCTVGQNEKLFGQKYFNYRNYVYIIQISLHIGKNERKEYSTAYISERSSNMSM